MMKGSIRTDMFLLLFAYGSVINSQEIRIPLYTGAIPYSKPSVTTEIVEKTDITVYRNVSVPEIAVYLPAKIFSTGQCVIICPGGGYGQLSYDLEGTDIAAFLNSAGVAAVVLKYRLPSKKYCTEPHNVPLSDARRAMRLVRYNAQKWNIDREMIGIMGFSAGGHLASTLGTHFDYGFNSSDDPVEQESSRPDFMILMYPVISFTDSVKHSGSRRNLIGENPGSDLIIKYSSELQVKYDTPPAFIVHSGDDPAVQVENSLLMYNALRKSKIPAELHILSEGGHGFGLALNNAHVSSWTNNLKLWLASLINAKAPENLFPPASYSPEYVIDWSKNHYKEKIAEFRAKPISKNKIVMAGNSLTEGGGDWSKLLGKSNVVNRGISGDVTEGVFMRIGEICYYKPAAIFIMIGINDINGGGKTAEETVANILRIVDKIKVQSPVTRIYVQSLLPTSSESLRGTIRKVNTGLRSGAGSSGYIYVDVYSEFTGKDELMKKELTSDGIHLNNNGYEKWAMVLRQFMN